MSLLEERLERLLALEPDELEALAVNGMVGPEIGQDPEDALVLRVARGVKPAAIDIGVAGARRAKFLGLVVRVLGGFMPDDEAFRFSEWRDAEGDFSPDAERPPGITLDYAIAATVEAMDELEHAYLVPGATGLRDDSSAARLGLALGYSDADVAAYLVGIRRYRLAAPTSAELDRLRDGRDGSQPIPPGSAPYGAS